MKYRYVLQMDKLRYRDSKSLVHSHTSGDREREGFSMRPDYCELVEMKSLRLVNLPKLLTPGEISHVQFPRWSAFHSSAYQERWL